jgi:hypothetical protein
MKRQLHSSSPPSSPLSNSQISDEYEPIPKRPRIFVSSPTPPPDNDNEIDDDEENDDDGEEEEIIIDDPIIPSVTITENRLEMILSSKIHSFFLSYLLVKMNILVMKMMMILLKLNSKIPIYLLKELIMRSSLFRIPNRMIIVMIKELM